MELTHIQWALVLPCGAAASCLGSLVGLGGGVFMVPILVLAYGVPLKMAVPAASFCIFPAALLTTAFNVRRRLIDYRAGAAMEGPAFFGALAGTALIGVLPVVPLQTVFACFVTWMGTKFMGTRKTPTGRSVLERLNALPPVWSKAGPGGQSLPIGVPALVTAGFGSGLMAGMFGVGGGIIKTPVMLRVFGMSARSASATSIFTIMFTSATAAFAHWRLGNLYWGLALPLSAAFLVGSLVANTWGAGLKGPTLEKALGWALLVAGATLLVRTFL